jgi:hypothetical protein
MEFVYIEPGEFMMGSKESAKALAEKYDATEDFFADEKQHEVDLSKGFCIQERHINE